MAVQFNLNDSVLVKLRPEGRKVLEDHYRGLRLDPEVYIKSMAQWDGRLKMPVWEMMHLFGAGTSIGFDPLIETTVEFAP